MKKFVLGMLFAVLMGAGCTAEQRQGINTMFSTVESGVNQAFQQASTVSVANVPAETGDTPLIVASRQGDLKKVKRLLTSGVDVNAANEKGTTALMAASQAGHVDIIRELATQKNLDLNAVDNNIDTALMLAVRNNQLEAVKTLLKAGADPESLKAGMSALITASYMGYADIVQALLEGGADVYWVDENNESALDVAINTNHPEVEAVLREYQSKHQAK